MDVDAVPPLSVTGDPETPSMVNVTVPVGVPAGDETVAVNVTFCPHVDGFALEPVSEAPLDRAAIERFRTGYRDRFGAATDDPVYEAVSQGRRHPGYERQVFDYYRKNPEALNNLRVPIFEDKVVDFIVEMAKVNDKSVTPDELMREPDDDKA